MSLLFSDIPPNISLFIDANIFIYHFIGPSRFSEPVKNLLLRIENHELVGFTSSLVISEVLHRLILSEAVEKLGLPLKGIVQYLKNNPSSVSQLEKYSKAPQKIQQMGIMPLACNIDTFIISAHLRERFGLLINDSVNLAIMQENHISHLASNDNDFDRVDFITTYKPC